MKHLPRFLNRFLLFIFGLIALIVGADLLVIVAWKKAAHIRQHGAHLLIRDYNHLSQKTRTVFNPHISWLTIGLVAITIIVAIIMLIWISRQGGGSTRKIDFQESEQADGTTVASLKFIDALVNDVIEDDKWIADVKTQGWKIKRHNGLLIKVITHKGADPERLKEKLNQVLARIDSTLGREIPICVHLTTGWRTALTTAQRVDK